jgi:uncharacterized protein YoxC
MNKNYLIIGLAILCFILFFVNNRRINKSDSTIKDIKKINLALEHKNDSLNKVNFEILKNIKKLDADIKAKDSLISIADTRIKKLKNRLNEVDINVNSLGANDVASEFDKYLQK